VEQIGKKMIDSITGIIQRKEPTNLFIHMNGLVFNISICLKDYEQLPELNQEITVLTYLNVREDLMELYGFLEYERRRLFVQLIGVSGIGPRTAINLLSNISVAHFKENIVAEDVKSLSLIPGIGPKTAQRIILDIREKITKDKATKEGLDVSKINFTYDDIYTALSSLGYRKNQIDKAIKQLTKENSFEGNIEDVIKKILNIIR
jgi:holliday junction DNA helicase RuvA|tara:strand:- start:1814 stop:2428 length:615 start_codon:yes stop_codon:yes gene_type:complete